MKELTRRAAALILAVLIAAALPGCGATATLPAAATAESAWAMPTPESARPATAESAGGTATPESAGQQGTRADAGALPQPEEQTQLLAALLAQIIARVEGVEVNSAGWNTVFTDSVAESLNSFCAEQPGSISVWVKDISSGETYTYDPETPYYAASTLKAPYALWLCQRVDAGDFSLMTPVMNTHPGQLAGSTLAEYDESKTIPLGTLLRAMVADSDNNATDMLMRAYPGTEETGFTQFLRELGFTYPETCEMTHEGIEGYCTAADGGAVMQVLYYYLEGNAASAAALKEMFCAADHEMLYIPQGVAAAKKYGSWDEAFHDEAIVYAENPYIICCYTDWGETDVDFPPEAVARMRELGRLVYTVLL